MACVCVLGGATRGGRLLPPQQCVQVVLVQQGIEVQVTGLSLSLGLGYQGRQVHIKGGGSCQPLCGRAHQLPLALLPPPLVLALTATAAAAAAHNALQPLVQVILSRQCRPTAPGSATQGCSPCRRLVGCTAACTAACTACTARMPPPPCLRYVGQGAGGLGDEGPDGGGVPPGAGVQVLHERLDIHSVHRVPRVKRLIKHAAVSRHHQHTAHVAVGLISGSCCHYVAVGFGAAGVDNGDVG
mmetsp:Transcript_6431/g.14307  ORF Transcript_6431/g.14307 Transcript_6431/m.14307 type:complete len:242 (-) Transcript_6431:743-1468(-)